MKKASLILGTTAAIAALAIFSYGNAPKVQADADTLSESQKTEINSLIESFIKDNPEKLITSLEAYQIQQQQEQAEKSAAEAKLVVSDLQSSDNFPIAGNKDGSIIIAEFFDYNCGYCKKALPAVQQAIDEDKDVKFVFIELPILGPSSSLASQYALAADMQGKYFEYHSALMEQQGQKTASILEAIGKDLGLDVEKLKEDAKSDAVAELIATNRKMAERIGVSGTPAFIIGDEIVRGYVPYDGMKQIIKAQKEKAESKEG